MNQTRFSKAKRKLMHFDWGSPEYVHKLEKDFLESNPVEKGLDSVDGKLDINQKCAFSSGQQYPVSPLTEGWQQSRKQGAKNGDCPLLLCLCGASSGVPHAGLGPQEGQ